MIVNLMLFLCVYYKNVQLHVLILCTPPPYVMCCCVMLRAPTHLKHGTPIMSLLLVVVDVCQEVSVFSIFPGKQL